MNAPPCILSKPTNCKGQWCFLNQAFAQDYKSDKYRPEWYKHKTSIGIVCKVPCWGKEAGKTLLYFGNKETNLDEDTMRAWADDVMKKLDEGEHPTNVLKWVQDAIQS